jgi:hypothetical protein
MAQRTHFALLGLVTAGLVLAATGNAFGRCGESAGDEDAIAAARAQVERDCPCVSFTHHGAYVSCAAAVATQRTRDGLLPRDCKDRVKRCAERSTCGRAGFVTCCRTDAAGTTKCQTREARQLKPPCTPPRGGTACVANVPSCCDACTEGGCAGSTTTTSSTTTTTTQPSSCHLDETTARCTGSCAVSGEGCVLAASGACVCSPFVCRQCFLTIGVNICINHFCSASVPCGQPNEYCDLGDCPAVECPCCPVCGDGICVSQDEGSCSCPADCGPPASCQPRTPICGDAVCDRFSTPGESHETCPQDCPFACHACPP